MNIYFDIETIPSQRADAHERARKSVKPPGTLKKAESIAAWWENDSNAAIEDAYRRQALDAADGEICAIAYSTDDVKCFSHVRTRDISEWEFLISVLDNLAQLIADHSSIHDSSPFFIAHNTPFDLGFLKRRCWVNQIRPPFRIPGPDARDGRDYGDTMTRWAGYRGTISLDRLCHAFDLPSPKDDGIDGSMVYSMWLDGKYREIGEYNMRDMEAVRVLWELMT